MQTDGYTKLHASLLTSTIWLEADHIRIVWVTLLALANKEGIVQGSVPGLANVARVPVDKCREAIERLLSPDPDSRSGAENGKRIETIQGGWRLINFEYYRHLHSIEERREYNRRWMSERRKSTKVHTSPQTSTESTGGQCGDKQKQKQETEAGSQSSSAKLTDAELIYAEYPRKQGKTAALKAINVALKSKSRDELIEAARAFGAATKIWPASDHQFIPHPATWFNQGRYDDDRANWTRNPNGNKTDNRPNSRRYENMPDYSGIQNHGLVPKP